MKYQVRDCSENFEKRTVEAYDEEQAAEKYVELIDKEDSEACESSEEVEVYSEETKQWIKFTVYRDFIIDYIAYEQDHK